MVPVTMILSPGLAESTGEAHAFGNEADTTGIDEHAIAVAAINDLGVARDNMDAGLLGHFGHAFADALQIGNGETLFQDEPTAEVLGNSTTGGNVVNRACHTASLPMSPPGKKWGVTTKLSVE